MDLERVNQDQVTKEFVAVIFAGAGDGLSPLTSDHGDTPSPKSLLPIANKPLIDHVLLWLEQSGIKDVLLLCPTRHRSSIYHHIHSNISPSSLSIDLQTFDDGEHDGTCGLLRHFSSRISEDFVIVPCDFIPPPTLPLSLILNKFRVEAPSKEYLVTTCWYASQTPDKTFDAWGPAVAYPIIWDALAETLLHIHTPDDKEKNSKNFQLRMSLLSMFPRTTMSTTFEDSHVYVCKRSILELLNEKPKFSSLREDFLPWLCQLQYRHSIAKRPNVGIVIHDKPDLAMRINTLRNFYEITKHILAQTTYTAPEDPKDRSLIDQRAQISTDSIVGESTQISERTNIKKSVIGRHCIIGRMVKIHGCVLLDHCVIEDGAKLEGCVLGRNTQVGNKAELTRCVTQAGYEVSSGETIKGEKLEVSNWMVASDELDEMSE